MGPLRLSQRIIFISQQLATSLPSHLAQQHLPLDIPEADVQATNRANGTVSRKHHQNRQQHDFCLPFAAASTAPPDSTCSASIMASITFASLKADRSTYKAAPKQAANQAASRSIIRRRRGARFWSRNDGNNRGGTRHAGQTVGVPQDRVQDRA